MQADRVPPFNLGTGRGYSVREVVATVERVPGRAVPVREVGRRTGDPPRLVADSSKQPASFLASGDHTNRMELENKEPGTLSY